MLLLASLPIHGTDDPYHQSEFAIFYSSWGWNLLEKPLEKKIGGLLENRIQDLLVDEISGDFPQAVVHSYQQTIDFDSGGSNFGFEARWYPGGRDTTISLGFSVERSSWRIAFPLVAVRMVVKSDLKPGDYGLVEGQVENVQLRIEPLSFQFKIQWDWWPQWRVHPFFSFGAGLFSIRSFEEGRFTLKYTADLGIPNVANKHYEDSFDESVREFIDNSGDDGSEIKLPSVLPIVELHLGVRAKLSKHISIRVDGGFSNGFVIRGTVSYRI